VVADKLETKRFIIVDDPVIVGPGIHSYKLKPAFLCMLPGPVQHFFKLHLPFEFWIDDNPMQIKRISLLPFLPDMRVCILYRKKAQHVAMLDDFILLLTPDIISEPILIDIVPYLISILAI